ncbi:hypothetical protein CDAR_486711 [Caerostris darwini]|uniref:Uncharacterized protein n=1 Tax=Caerostris darwini TaxID=1538125 RepID=A0AAV4NZ66_9ARAC|nr:hypothetical protein CDAR_486711 [Caerostris darwini]
MIKKMMVTLHYFGSIRNHFEVTKPITKSRSSLLIFLHNESSEHYVFYAYLFERRNKNSSSSHYDENSSSSEVVLSFPSFLGDWVLPRFLLPLNDVWYNRNGISPPRPRTLTAGRANGGLMNWASLGGNCVQLKVREKFDGRLLCCLMY